MNTMIRTILGSFAVGIFLAVVLAGAAYAGDKDSRNMDSPHPEKEAACGPLVEGMNAFNWNVYQELSGDRDSNIFYSPYSIYQALAMTLEGARGETADQMAKVLHSRGDSAALSASAADLDATLKSRGQGAGDRGEPFQFTVANALWGQKDFSFRKAFTDSLAKNYGAGLQLVDYKNDANGARGIINAWVEDKTNQKIKDLLPPGVLNTDTRLVLTNAIYFKAAWAAQFKKSSTAKKEFHLENGNTVSVDMMRIENKFRYYEDENVQAAVLPYVGNEMSMIIMLPRAGRFDAVEKQITGEDSASGIPALDMTGEFRNLDLQVPRFRMETQFSLSAVLKRMGMDRAFADNADFSGMTETESLKLDDVIHKAFVDVNEEGTEAAAATAVIIGTTSFEQPQPPVPFVCDRPFLFVVRDNATSAILFTGRVANPMN